MADMGCLLFGFDCFGCKVRPAPYLNLTLELTLNLTLPDAATQQPASVGGAGDWGHKCSRLY